VGRLLTLRVLILTLAVIGTLVATPVRGQVPPASEQQARLFEASVKPNLSKDSPERVSMQPTGFRFTGFQLRTLIRTVYGPGSDIQTYDQIVGGPPWLAAERFDIVAKVDQRLEAGPEGQRPNLIPTVLKAILEDRFRVKVHIERREMPAYALRLVRSGQLGPELHASLIKCPTFVVGAPLIAEDPVRWCGFRNGAGEIRAQHVTMGQVAAALAGIPLIGRPIVDRTGLTGNYDFRIVVTGEEGASIFTVLREQTGLTLQNEKASIPVIVIDHVERPTPD
jgi:uncharacterized protein (TIGR03435 family)